MRDWRALFGRTAKRKTALPPDNFLLGDSPQRPTPGTHKTTDKASTSAANGLKLALRLLKEAVTGIGVPGLEAAVSGVVKVIDIIESVHDNDRDLSNSSRRISNVATAISKSPRLHAKDEVPEALRLRMESFLKELQVLLDEVEAILNDRSLLVRTANSEDNRNTITEINASIDQLIIQFSAEGIISLELNMVSARQDVRAVGRKVDDVDQKVDSVKEAQLAQECEALIQSMPRVKARYDDTSTKPSRSCHPGTRIDLLQSLNKWIKDGPDDTPYLWLCGEVGVGKTTVAHTIAEEQDGLEQLGASFFFSRHESDRQAPYLLFPSLAYQLARFDRGVWRALAETLKRDPDIVNRDLSKQLSKLILEPLSRSGMRPSRTVVIVIDGLDECTDPASILDALASGVKDVSVRLRVLVCSRPYAAIQAKFKNTPLYHLATQNHFHDINPRTLSSDVAAYLTWSLREIASRPANRHLPSPWPAEGQLAELIDRASGLFIVGSTYTKYIDDPVEDNPAAQLKRILSRKRGIGSSPLAELDALYDQVLDDLKRSLRTADELAIARNIIETVVLAQSEMSVTTCSSLLCMEPSDVRSVLRRLTAVILLPEDEDGAVTPFHSSFGEYIQDDARCAVRELSVNAASAHGRIADRCINTMRTAAEHGIIGVEYDSYEMPLHLKYASVNLAAHISSSRDDESGSRENAMRHGVWTWLNLLFTNNSAVDRIKDDVKKAGFNRLLKVEGLDVEAETREISIEELMIVTHTRAINRTPQIQLPTPPTDSPVVRLSKGIQLIKFSVYGDLADRLKGVLKLAVDSRRWNNHNYPDMSVQLFSADLTSPNEVQLLVSSPTSLRGILSLSKYLAEREDLEAMSGIRLALDIAKCVCYFHETSPYPIGGWLVPDFILVSAEGKPVFAPGEWSVVKSEVSEDLSDVDMSDCQMRRVSPLGQTQHWFHPEGVKYYTGRAQQSIAVWDFSSILYRIMTGTSPLSRYWQIAQGQPDLGYDESMGVVPREYWNDSSLEPHVCEGRFEKAVALLLDTIEECEEVKAVLKACWAFKPQDRPSMRAVVKQLEAIIGAAEEAP